MSLDHTIQLCCPPFDPEPWDEKTIVWKDKLFVKDRIRSLFHIPLNFGKIVRKNAIKISRARAMPEKMLVITDEYSLWGTHVFFAVDSPVPDAEMTTISGTFFCKVFEGPYSHIRNWIREIQQLTEKQGRKSDELFFYYPTCPRCSERYGKTSTVILARI